MSLLQRAIAGVKHNGKEKLKLQFEINVQKINNLLEFNHKPVLIEWRRGSKKNSGKVKPVVVSNGEAIWNEKIMLKCSFYKDTETGKFDEKTISFAAKVVCEHHSSLTLLCLLMMYIIKNDGPTIGKLVVDLAHYAKSETLHASEIAFNNKKRGSPILHVSVSHLFLAVSSSCMLF
jgi:hypothetical protein